MSVSHVHLSVCYINSGPGGSVHEWPWGSVQMPSQTCRSPSLLPAGWPVCLTFNYYKLVCIPKGFRPKMFPPSVWAPHSAFVLTVLPWNPLRLLQNFCSSIYALLVSPTRSGSEEIMSYQVTASDHSDTEMAGRSLNLVRRFSTHWFPFSQKMATADRHKQLL